MKCENLKVLCTLCEKSIIKKDINEHRCKRGMAKKIEILEKQLQ